jgi:ABC-2 type transport system ATP-binding protein
MVAAVGARSLAPGELQLVPALVVDEVGRRFGKIVALDDVSLEVRPGEVHALLGPNGAGKTTLLRVLTGLATPTSGRATVLGANAADQRAALQDRIGFVPSGDRTFYLRLSGEENLLFFARLHGMRKAAARERAREVLAEVGLADAARRPASTYSHGMQKRLSVARALLASPPVLLVDEATHDLDPENAERVRALVASLAAGGSAVLWATQRIDEIRGFASRVTLLAEGRVRFAGAVSSLLAQAEARRFVLRVAFSRAPDDLLAAVGDGARLTALPDRGHLLVELSPGAALGDVIAALSAAGARVHDCRRERSEAEDAFLALTGERGA